MQHEVLMRLVLASTAMLGPVLHAQQGESAAPGPTLEEVLDRVGQAEAALTARMKDLHPIVEVYIQSTTPDAQLGTVPSSDAYFLGQFEWSSTDGPKLRPLTPGKGTLQQTFGWVTRQFAMQYLPDGFAAMGVPDWRVLNRQRYEFTFVRREFLGETRCLVFDVRPKNGAGFSGRIWVEDRDYNIVRFNGINVSINQRLSNFFRKQIAFHVDSWRVNVLPGLWLPAYVYSEEATSAGRQTRSQIRSQVRLWGYKLKSVQPTQEFTAIRIDEPTVRDDARLAQQLSPVVSQRQWEQQAEDNVLERLAKAGLLAPPNDVDKVLETVVDNLLITNNLAVESGVRCRVLLTSPLESFTIGHTIVLSRGLIDVLPDEASLAMMLAHELAHVVLGHQVIDTKFAFADRLMVPDNELLGTVLFRHEVREELAADAKVIELLKRSPYKDKLSDAGLFLRAVAARAKQLPNLIQPHLGEQLADSKQVLRLNELMQQAPELAPERLDQIAALPLGARIVVDPWSGRVELLRTPTVPLVSAREKVALAVTPLVPYIKYADAAVASSR